MKTRKNRSSFPLRSRPRVLRGLALGAALCFAWSFVLAGSARAVTAHPPLPVGHVRTLSAAEMDGILGAANPQVPQGGSENVDLPSSANTGGYAWVVTLNGSTVATDTSPNGWSVSTATPVKVVVSPPASAAVATNYYVVSRMYYNNGPAGYFDVIGGGGAARPWQASSGGTNTMSGNKTITHSLVGWTARGGLPVGFALTHNSRSARNAELGPKWVASYDVSLAANSGGGVTVSWGDGRADPYAAGSYGTFTPVGGVHDTLVANGTPVTSYDLTTKDQVKYHFTNPNGTAWLLATISDENGNTITVNHNTSDQVTSVVDPTSRTLTLGYTSGKLTSVTDPLSRVWTLGYDTSGNLQTITWPALGGTSYTQQFGYNANHDVTSVTDRRGHVRSLGYNLDDSLAWEQDALGNQTNYSYSTSQTVVTDPNGHTTTQNYANGSLSSVADAAGKTESYSYDSNFNVSQKTDKRGKVWQYTYDSAGNPLTAQDPLTHTVTSTYNSHNKLLTKTLPGGESVACTYDTNDNLTQVDEKNASGTVVATTTYTIGTYGLVTDKYDANSHHTTYGYDTNGDLTSVTTPRGKQTQWAYNGLGVKTSRTDALTRQTTYTLDAWERVTTATYPDTSTHTFSYDANGNVTSFTDATGTTSRTYDNDDRLTNESKGGSTVVSHTYDATGKRGLLSTTTDANGRVLTYAYTTRNQLYTVSETAGTTTYTYDDAGEETGVTNPNSTTVTKVYDDAGRLTSVTNKNSSSVTLSSFSYGYDTNDRRTSCTEASGDVVSYGYDAQGHLTSESRTGTNSYSATFTVDGVGNRTASTLGLTSTSYTYDNDDELTATSGGFVNSYTYNANGEQTGRTLSGTSRTLSYDYDGQLTSTGTGGATFAYDAAGRRVSRTAGGTTTTFLYDGNQVLLEKQGSTTTGTYTYGNSLVRKDGEVPLFDGLGSERTVTDSSQAVTGTLTLAAFGQTVASTGSSTNPYQFGATSGYRNDGDAGLMQVGCRYYDAQVGRFVTRDTVLTEKPYAYCDGDPVNHLDPSGNSWVDDVEHSGQIGFGIIAIIVATDPIVLAGGAFAVAIAAAQLLYAHWKDIKAPPGVNGFDQGAPWEPPVWHKGDPIQHYKPEYPDQYSSF